MVDRFRSRVRLSSRTTSETVHSLCCEERPAIPAPSLPMARPRRGRLAWL